MQVCQERHGLETEPVWREERKAEGKEGREKGTKKEKKKEKKTAELWIMGVYKST